MKHYIGILCGLLSLLSIAQAQEKTSPFWGKEEAYLTNQTVKTFELVNQLLAENPPSTETPSLARRSALMLLDGIMHVPVWTGIRFIRISSTHAYVM